MTDVGGASSGPALTPLSPPGRGPSTWVALGLLTTAFVALVGISLAAQSGDRPGPQAAGGGPGTPPVVTPVATPSPTASPEPPPGTPPPRVAVAVGAAPACPPGSTPDTPGPADQARPSSDAPTAQAFDRRAGRLVALVDAVGGVETWTLDVCTNTWTRMHPDREPPGLGDLVYDIDSDVTIGVSWRDEGTSAIWAYDLQANTWTEKGSTPPGFPRLGLELYDPVSGHVVAVAAERTDEANPDTIALYLWSYDVDTDSWIPIRQANQPAVEPRAYAYDASVDRIVAYSDAGGRLGEGSTWLFDLPTGFSTSGAWSATGAVTPAFPYGWWGMEPTIAYDETAERSVMVGQGRSAAYDASADRWEILFEAPAEDEPGACTRPECRVGRQVVYDAVNGRLVAYGGEVYTTCTWEAPDDVLAFDMATRSWTLVLPPAPGPPPLRDLASQAPGSTDPERSPWIRAAKVTLHGGAFYRRVVGVADEPWSSTPPVAPATVVDGLFVPECQLWTEDTVWWEETTSDPSSRAWIEIELGGAFVLDAAVIQADVNDGYWLSYRDPETAGWVLLWDVPLGEAGGMATRPQQGDASVRWPLARPVVTDALRFEATHGDAQYSVSEIAVFGRPAP